MKDFPKGNQKKRLESKQKKMVINIRNSRLEEYKTAEAIMMQVQQMHIDWRPDIYKYSETVLSIETYKQAVQDGTFFVAEYEGNVAGILFIIFRHIENPNQVTRDIIFIDSIAVDEKYRGKGIGHAFLDFLIDLRNQKGHDGIELQVNAKNKAACQFYSDYGFTSKSINMEIL